MDSESGGVEHGAEFAQELWTAGLASIGLRLCVCIGVCERGDGGEEAPADASD